ncbi:hypothetical protein GNAINCEL_00109 [Serratia phage KKP 3709]|nr:hypothetical protein GNAINCEL_00109 [Serratia phage KKP 3709]
MPVREYDDVKVRIGRPTQRDVLNHCGEDSVMLCAYNSTRNYLNTRARVATGHSGLMPNIGEKVICTFNQHGPGFFNGEQGIVLGYEDLSLEEAAKQENEDLQFIVLRSLTDGRELKAFFNPLCFNHPEPEMRPMFQKYKGGFDFGYALTIHKSQRKRVGQRIADGGNAAGNALQQADVYRYHPRGQESYVLQEGLT